VAEEVWWCELGDELCEFGSGGRTHPRAGPVNVALDGTHRQSERFGYLNVGQTAPVGPILWCNPTSAAVTLFLPLPRRRIDGRTESRPPGEREEGWSMTDYTGAPNGQRLFVDIRGASGCAS